MRISVFGTGYVGLVTGTCLADAGHEVICIDVDAAKIQALQQGHIPIYEPGLADLVQRNLAAGRLHFTTDAAWGVSASLLQFIAVGTPADEDGSADLHYVLAVARTLGEHMQDYKLVINKSTVPVGTAEKVQACIQETLNQRQVNVDFDVCSNPEFLKEGAAIADFTQGARILVGTESARVRELMTQCYAPFLQDQPQKLIFMQVRAAELSKYAANAMLATKISFINEMANLAERMGADIEQIRLGIGSDPRIGPHFIQAGCGYGGSCFPKDVQALAHMAEQVGYSARLLDAVEAVNHQQKQRMFEKLQQALAETQGTTSLVGCTFAVWGLAFKPETDDMREAPSRALLEALWQAGARVQAYDPQAQAECARIYGTRPELDLCTSAQQALIGADALLICTEWQEFRQVSATWLAQHLASKLVIDGRNLYDPPAMQAAGLRYYAIGRGDSLAPVL